MKVSKVAQPKFKITRDYGTFKSGGPYFNVDALALLIKPDESDGAISFSLQRDAPESTRGPIKH